MYLLMFCLEYFCNWCKDLYVFVLNISDICSMVCRTSVSHSVEISSEEIKYWKWKSIHQIIKTQRDGNQKISFVKTLF